MRGTQTVGTYTVTCPACGTDIDVPVTVHLVTDEQTGRQTLRLDQDLTDVWAHAWTHEGER